MADHCRPVDVQVIEERDEIVGVIGQGEGRRRFVGKTMTAEIDREEWPSYGMIVAAWQQRQPRSPHSPDSMQEEYRYAGAWPLDSVQRLAGRDPKSVLDESF